MLMYCKVLTRVDYARLQKVAQSFRAVGGQIRQLAAVMERELEQAIKVPGERIGADLVTMNAKVRVRNFQTRRAIEVELVYPIDADPMRGRVSVFAPLGMALLGSRVGDTVTVRSVAGTACYYVESMLYQPEARPERAEHTDRPARSGARHRGLFPQTPHFAERSN